ncbi:hypothetical protein BDR06DRAFT_956413 [Suillus hirtellus]|nr:hypothetical protein BDR06DRAFT_956413 [Suillus hirtellus]
MSLRWTIPISASAIDITPALADSNDDLDMTCRPSGSFVEAKRHDSLSSVIKFTCLVLFTITVCQDLIDTSKQRLVLAPNVNPFTRMSPISGAAMNPSYRHFFPFGYLEEQQCCDSRSRNNIHNTL